MFYYLFGSSLVYHWVLILAAVIPAFFLMIKVYKSDWLEKESAGLLWKLVKAGVFATLLALVEERVGEWILSQFVESGTVLYEVILYFGIVAFAEETSKYILMKKNTWNDPEFNCRYDGVVYAVFTSLGFALWENISYVTMYGFSTALVRAVTAIPGHACFGVFMGIFYGHAKELANDGKEALSKLMLVLSVLIPALLHGAYDYIATQSSTKGDLYFVIFVAVMFFLSYFLMKKTSREDQFI